MVNLRNVPDVQHMVCVVNIWPVTVPVHYVLNSKSVLNWTVTHNALTSVLQRAYMHPTIIFLELLLHILNF